MDDRRRERAGVRGASAFDLVRAATVRARGAGLRGLLKENPVLMTSELDEQGLQAAALQRSGEPLVVTVEEVTICSPFPPHLPYLGRCGAHFCGLNARQFSWSLEGRNAAEYIRENWLRLREPIYEKVSPGESPAHLPASHVGGRAGTEGSPHGNGASSIRQERSD